MPLGKHKLAASLRLREAMFINGILTNSEVWYAIKNEEIQRLQEADEYLLRKLLKAHSKTAKECLYLETGTIPIKYVVMSRRLNYFHHIITRDTNELISRVYVAQKRRPVKDDWVLTVKKDKLALGIKENDNVLNKYSKNMFKKFIKHKIRSLAFSELKQIQMGHSKVNQITYNKFDTQKYLKGSNFSNKEICLLFKLRTRMVDVKNNFTLFYGDLLCRLCQKEEENQEHLIFL